MLTSVAELPIQQATVIYATQNITLITVTCVGCRLCIRKGYTILLFSFTLARQT